MTVIYRTRKEQVIERICLADALLFDVDNTLIDHGKSRNNPSMNVSWRIIEKNIGLDRNQEHKEILEKYKEESRKKGEKSKKLAEELNLFYKGYSLSQLKEGLYPIPYLPNVLTFFEELKKFRKSFLLGIISSAPTFYVDDIAKELGMDFWEGCDVLFDERGICTGEMKSNGIYGKGKSIENFCKTHRISPERIVYHGDEKYDIDALKISGIGIAFDPIGGENGEVAKASDVILYDWSKHPLIEIIKKNKTNI